MTRPSLREIVASGADRATETLGPADAPAWDAWRQLERAYEVGTVDAMKTGASDYMELRPDEAPETACVLGAFLLARGETADAFEIFDAVVRRLLGSEAYHLATINALLGRSAAHLAVGHGRAARADAAIAAELFFHEPDFYVGDASPFGGPGWCAQLVSDYPILPTLTVLSAPGVPVTATLRGRLLHMRFVASGGGDRTMLEEARALLGDDPALMAWMDDLG